MIDTLIRSRVLLLPVPECLAWFQLQLCATSVQYRWALRLAHATIPIRLVQSNRVCIGESNYPVAMMCEHSVVASVG